MSGATRANARTPQGVGDSVMRVAHRAAKGSSAKLWQQLMGYARLPNLTVSRGQARRLITFLALFAFSIQTFVVQTHVHIPPSSSVSGSLEYAGNATDQTAKAVAADPDAGPHDKYPIDSDPANCPLCQEMVQAGHFITPTAILLLLVFVVIANVAIYNDSIRISAPSHYWQGRGPPHI